MEVRITKYNPEFRCEKGWYLLVDEWTSVSDVDKIDDFTYEEYLRVEENHWKVLESILTNLNVNKLQIVNLEYYHSDGFSSGNHLQEQSVEFLNKASICEGKFVELSEFKHYFNAAMREMVWFTAEAPNGTFVHFGYDYYLYAGSNVDFSWVSVDGVFVEPFISPYHGE